MLNYFAINHAKELQYYHSCHSERSERIWLTCVALRLAQRNAKSCLLEEMDCFTCDNAFQKDSFAALRMTGVEQLKYHQQT